MELIGRIQMAEEGQDTCAGLVIVSVVTGNKISRD